LCQLFFPARFFAKSNEKPVLFAGWPVSERVDVIEK